MKKILLFTALIAFFNSPAQNIGINNASPQVPLDILKVGGGNIVRLLNPSSTTGAAVGILFTNSASYSIPGFNSASILAVRKPSGGQDMIFSVSQTIGAALERMRIDSFGNMLLNEGRLGLGITNPSYDLHIYRNTPSIGFYDEDDAHFSGSITGDSTDLMINAYRKANSGSGGGNLILQTNGSGFVTFGSGRVGIGTADPTAKLHVTSNVLIGTGTPATGYLLSVNGKIISEEVRVELDGAWPDYVFEKGYHLPSLKQLENYIQRNKHLPNIPTAGQVEKEGFDLGDMNRRLLEKIEELTLYIIQQEKRLNSLQSQVNSIQAK